MDPRLVSILELQEVMSTQQEIEKEYEIIPKRRDEINSEQEAIINKIATIEEQITNYELELNKVELDLKQGQESRVKKEAQIFSLKTTKEVQATQSEIENIDRKNTRYEERQVELTNLIEKAKSEKDKQKTKLDEKKSQLQSELNELDHKEKNLGPQLEQARSNTEEIANRLQPNLYQKFIRVFKGRNGIAIAAANDGYCGACNVRLTPRLIQIAKRGQDIVQCEGCSRFLYWDNSFDEDDLDAL